MQGLDLNTIYNVMSSSLMTNDQLKYIIYYFKNDQEKRAAG